MTSNPTLHVPSQDDLIATALGATSHAYIPYSGYPVGVALLSADGRLFTGCNVENASFPAGICGERTALVKAVSEGARHFSTLVVATRDGGSPCGICRQMLSEFGTSLTIVMVTLDGTVKAQMLLSELLPMAFGNDSLHDASDHASP